VHRPLPEPIAWSNHDPGYPGCRFSTVEADAKLVG